MGPSVHWQSRRRYGVRHVAIECAAAGVAQRAVRAAGAKEVSVSLLLHDCAPAALVGRGIDPRLQRHSAGQVQGVRIVYRNPTVRTVEGCSLSEFPIGGPGGALQGAVIAVAGSIARSGARAFLERIGGYQIGTRLSKDNVCPQEKRKEYDEYSSRLRSSHYDSAPALFGRDWGQLRKAIVGALKPWEQLRNVRWPYKPKVIKGHESFVINCLEESRFLLL